jgi:outer membrane lipoprotein SlyB
MEAPQTTQMIREAVGVFHDRKSFLTAVEELMVAGFDRAELSLLAAERAVQEKLGHAYQKVQELEDDAAVPRAAFVGNHSLAEARTGIIGGLAYIGAMAAAGAVVASGGAVAAAIAAAVAAGGGGGLIGAWAARLLGRDRAKELQKQLDHGGLLLWVRLRDEAHERRATEILSKSGAEDVHVHELPASELPANNPLSGVELDPFLPGARI